MKIVHWLSLVWLTSCSVFGVRDTPEPAYEALARLGPVAIRQYGPRIAAETTVQGDEASARSRGFRRLAGYIFGANHARANIAMTAPVAQEPDRDGATIAMTAPFAQEASLPNEWRIRFFMPANYTLATLPVPNDDSVKLFQVPVETYAVLRFSGLATAQAVQDETHRLLEMLGGQEWAPMGSPVVWFYDPPWTLPPFRRNEVAVAVQKR